MRIDRGIILFLLLLVPILLFAQTDSTEIDESDEGTLVIPKLNEQLKVGVKLGLGMCSMLGNELKNPRPAYMLSGGAYLRYKFKPHWFIQPEANISFRGSNFNNNDLEYTNIRMYCIDVPVLLMFGLNEKNTSNVFVGAQYSRTLNASLYTKNALVPESTSPGLNKNDVLAIAGTQFHTPFVGFQIALKYGLLDANDGLLPNLNPPNTGKDIHHFAIEINLLF